MQCSGLGPILWLYISWKPEVPLAAATAPRALIPAQGRSLQEVQGKAIWSWQLYKTRGVLCIHDAKQVNAKWICHPEKSKRLLYLWMRLRHSVSALLARHSPRIEMPTISTLAHISLSPSLPKCEALTHRTPKRDTGRDNTQFYTCVHTNK